MAVYLNGLYDKGVKVSLLIYRQNPLENGNFKLRLNERCTHNMEVLLFGLLAVVPCPALSYLCLSLIHHSGSQSGTEPYGAQNASALNNQGCIAG